jgi:hypothetical protein
MMNMKMHPGPLAPRGETIVQTRIPSDLALLTPLAVRLAQQLVTDGIRRRTEGLL